MLAGIEPGREVCDLSGCPDHSLWRSIGESSCGCDGEDIRRKGSVVQKVLEWSRAVVRGSNAGFVGAEQNGDLCDLCFCEQRQGRVVSDLAIGVASAAGVAQRMISVIIPAHNEEQVIGRCLEALTFNAEALELEIIVVCNGCTDDTASVARRHQPTVTVLETGVSSKTNALNIGDAAATGWPRFYVDADVALNIGAVREVARAMRESPGVLAAAPLMQFDFTDRPWGVRAFYEVWSALPYCRSGMIGSGVYAISKELRGRFDQFPQITADDAYVRLHCKPEERLTVVSCRFTVFPPRKIGALVKISTRAYFGDYELRARSPELFLNKQGQPWGGLCWDC